MASIKFDLAPVTDPERCVKGSATDQQPVGSAWSNQPFNQLPGELQYGPFGGIPPFVRASIPRIAYAKLAATGVLAALVSMSASDKEAAFSCALAAAVNFIACAHYHYILKIRAQELPPSLLQFASGRDLQGSWIGSKDNENEYQKMFAQEMAVDALRHSDWTVSHAYSHTNPPARARFPLAHFAMFWDNTSTSLSASNADSK